MSERHNRESVTVLLSAGRLPLELTVLARELAAEYNLSLYLSTQQNLRFTGISEEAKEEVKQRLLAAGFELKAPGKFPIPRICLGMKHCNLGKIDTFIVSDMILERFRNRTWTKAKFKIAISGCTMCCSGTKTSDIGIVATRDGLELYVGGKGGANPRVARRIGRNLSAEQVVDILADLVAFHDQKTIKKQRFYKLLEDPDFSWEEV